MATNYTKISQLTLNSNNNLSLDKIKDNNINNIISNFLSTELKSINIADYAFCTKKVSKLANQTCKLFLNLTDKSTLEFYNTISTSALLKDKNLLVDNNAIYHFQLENNWDSPLSIPITSIIDNFNYSEISLSPFIKVGATIDSDSDVISALKFDNQQIMGIDVNIKSLNDLEIINNPDLYSITLCEFDNLKKFIANNNKCSGCIYIGKIAEDIHKIDISNCNFNYIIIEGNNTILSPVNCKIKQNINSTIKFINCRVSEELKNSLSGNNLIID